MQALYDLTAPGGVAPAALSMDGQVLGDGPWLIEVQPRERRGRGRWWCRGGDGSGAGYTDQLDRAGLFTRADSAVGPALLRPGSSDTHSKLVDAQVLVGPALRMQDKLRQLYATAPIEDSLTRWLVALHPSHPDADVEELREERLSAAPWLDPDDRRLDEVVRQHLAERLPHALRMRELSEEETHEIMQALQALKRVQPPMVLVSIPPTVRVEVREHSPEAQLLREGPEGRQLAPGYRVDLRTGECTLDHVAVQRPGGGE